MFNWYEKIERYYKLGYYDNEKVAIFVDCNKITKEEYKKITNEVSTQ